LAFNLPPYVPAAAIPPQSGAINPPGGVYGLFFNQPQPNYDPLYAYYFGGPQALSCSQCPPGEHCAGCPFVTPPGFVSTGNAPPVEIGSGLSLNQPSTLFAGTGAKVGAMPAWGWAVLAVGGLLLLRGGGRRR